MAQVTIYGVGQTELTKVNINKTIEMDDLMARKIFGPEKRRMVSRLLKKYCPGINISCDQVGLNIVYNGRD